MGRVNTASALKLTTVQQEVLIGTILGDGRLECRSSIGSARLRIHHAESQKEFLFWKYDIFENLVTRRPWKITWKGNQTGAIYAAWFFHTMTLRELKPIHQMFYPESKKIIPKNIGNFLTPRALATWYMDDGCLSNRSIILNTQCFSIPEQVLLQNLFEENFGIKTTLNKDRSTYRMRLDYQGTNKFLEIVEPFVPECMQYKITPRND